MLVFIDESGDPGMKAKEGSSEFFVMVAVLFEEDAVALECDRRIEEFRVSKGWQRELKFSHMKPVDRGAFLEAVAGFDFFYLAFVLNKRRLWSPSFNDKETFWSYTASLLVNNAKVHLDDATIVIDQSVAIEISSSNCVCICSARSTDLQSAGTSRKLRWRIHAQIICCNWRT